MTVYQYDDRENLLSVTDPADRVTTFAYDPYGRLQSATDATNKTTTWVYGTDAEGNNTVTVTDPLGNAMVQTYDVMGRLMASQDPLGNVTLYEHNGLGKRVAVQHPDQTVREWAYNCCGTAWELDELGRETGYEYDAVNRLTKVVNRADPNNPRTLMQYAYDAAGVRDWMKDAQGRTTDYTTNARGLLTGTAFPDGTTESYAYNASGAVTSRTDRMGRPTTYSYDALYRLTGKSFQGQTKATYAYDAAGRMTTATAGQTSLAQSYFPTGRVETATQTIFGVARTFSYGYDDAGRVTSVTDETAAKTTSYAYYDNGWLHTITDGDGETVHFDYYADGSLQHKTLPNGSYTDYAYTNRGWLRDLVHKKADGTILKEYHYWDGLDPQAPWYDAVGNRTSVGTDEGPHAYTYDPLSLDRLTAATHPLPVPNEAFSYDTMGNRLTSAQWTNWSYDTANDELDSYDGIAFTYDANGNRATRTDAGGTTTYTYDYENRLIRVDKPGGSYAEYTYDALGRRVRKNLDGVMSLYWYDGEDIVLETDGSGVEQARYTHGPGIDNPVKLRRGGASYCYHEDPLGSVVLLTDATQAVANSYAYDAFGRMIVQTGSIPNPYAYTAREWDAEAGLYYYRARHYDAAAGRFLQTDPIGPTVREGNLYAYVGNRPIMLVDPSGKAPLIIAVPGGIVIVGVAGLKYLNYRQDYRIRSAQAAHFAAIYSNPDLDNERVRSVAYDLWKQFYPRAFSNGVMSGASIPVNSMNMPLPSGTEDLVSGGLLTLIMEALGLLDGCHQEGGSSAP